MNNLLSNEIENNEIEIEKSLRPLLLNDYIGQESLKNNLKIFIGAAKLRNEVLDHVLLYGPAGLGKTTLANIIANEMNAKLKTVNGPSIEKSGDLAAVLTSLEPGDCLFIDEIHRLPKVVEEVLYSAMEDFKLNVLISKETTSSSINLDLPPFTLIGATTRAGDLSSPLRARFGILEKINFYTIGELSEIVIRTAKFFGCEIDKISAREIAKRSRGTPRIANKIFRRVRDFANFNNRNFININDTKSALKALKIENNGLDEVDINYLLTLKDRFGGGPVGLETIASAIGEEKTNLDEVYEPYLLKLGFIDRTQKGRLLTLKGKAFIKNKKPLY